MMNELEVLKDVAERLERAGIAYMLQRKDARNLLSASADLAYLRKWARPLGVDALLEELLQ